MDMLPQATRDVAQVIEYDVDEPPTYLKSSNTDYYFADIFKSKAKVEECGSQEEKEEEEEEEFEECCEGHETKLTPIQTI